ncbi:MAG TPA: redoxin domain-containing protein [Capsulimonadaceae bacterium]|nr:redoxin domain-containing protein [Capsulimonadaceae bacterium]
MFSSNSAQTAPSPAKPAGPLVAGRAAPAFTLAGADGKQHQLSDYRGRPVVLFFYCGCQWCQQCAQAWGQMQRGGGLAPEPTNTKPGQPGPITLVVFAGDAPSVRGFADQEGLDPAQTVLLPDEEMHVTLDAYHAEPCPRVFVLDGKGIVRYTNNHKDDAPRKAPALAIVSHVIDAVRACERPKDAAKS